MFYFYASLLGFILIPFGLFSQQRDTLKHFDPNTGLSIERFTTGNNWGFYTGHNSWGDEGFAEKYFFSGNFELLGILAHHLGEAGTSNFNVHYHAYQVGNNGLPAASLGNKAIPYNDVPIDSQAFAVLFDQALNLSDSFFVGLDLGDYSHGGAGTKRIGLLHSPLEARPQADSSVFGRNAVKIHSHGAASWLDYRTQNFQSYRPMIHLAIFPIIQLSPTAQIQIEALDLDMRAIFPNPAQQAHLNWPLHNRGEDSPARFEIFDPQGRLIETINFNLSSGEQVFSYTPKTKLSQGHYLVCLSLKNQKISQIWQVLN